MTARADFASGVVTRRRALLVALFGLAAACDRSGTCMECGGAPPAVAFVTPARGATVRAPFAVSLIVDLQGGASPALASWGATFELASPPAEIWPDADGLLVATIEVTDVPPGDHRVQVTVTDPALELWSDADVTFVVAQ